MGDPAIGPHGNVDLAVGAARDVRWDQGQGGAEYGWMSTALLIEEAASKGQHATGGAADVFKCFDQLIRPVIYKLAAMGGGHAEAST